MVERSLATVGGMKWRWSVAKFMSVASSSSDSSIVGDIDGRFWSGEVREVLAEYIDAWSAAGDGPTHASLWKGDLPDIKDAKGRQ
jgi:hypothetical protein